MRKTREELFCTVNSLENIQKVVQGLVLSLRMSELTSQELNQEILEVIYDMTSTYCRISTEHCRNEWKEALDSHAKKIAKLTSELISMCTINGIVQPVISVRRSKIEFFDGFDLQEVTITPRSFWKLYRLFGYCTLCDKPNQFLGLLRVINTICSIRKDFLLNEQEQEEDILEQIREIESTDLMDSVGKDKYLHEITETLELITKVVNGEKLTEEPEVSRFASAVLLSKSNKGIGERPIPTSSQRKMSCASTCTRFRGETVPGLVASLVEGNLDPDFSYDNFDHIVAYKQNVIYNSFSSDYKSRRNYTVSIPKPNGVRLICLNSNSSHDRMLIFENMRKSIFRNYFPDCTFNQSKGRKAILKWFANKVGVASVYSLDLHACSNTLDRSKQALVTRYMLQWFSFNESDIDTLMDGWERMISFSTQVRLPYSKRIRKFTFATGQAMGMTDSFFSFSMLHHIIVITLIRILKRLEINVVGYVIVGDDFAIAIKSDPDFTVPDLYKDMMASANTECNLLKGYLYNKDIEEYEVPIAEFAKNLICEGIDLSPIPLRLLSQSDTMAGRINLLAWLTSHTDSFINPVMMSELLGCSDKEKVALSLLRRVPVKNQFNSEKSHLNMKRLMNIKQNKLMLACSVSLLKQTLILGSLRELYRDPNFIPKYSDELSFDRKFRKMIKQVINNPDCRKHYSDLDHKFTTWLNNLELQSMALNIGLEDILKGIAPDDDIIELIPSIRNLSDKNLEILMQLSKDIVDMDDPESGFTADNWAVDEFINSSLRELQGLDLLEFNTLDSNFWSKGRNASFGMDYEKFVDESFELYLKISETDDLVEVIGELTKEDGQDSEEPIEQAWIGELIDILAFGDEADDEDDYDPWEHLDS